MSYNCPDCTTPVQCVVVSADHNTYRRDPYHWDWTYEKDVTHDDVPFPEDPAYYYSYPSYSSPSYSYARCPCCVPDGHDAPMAFKSWADVDPEDVIPPAHEVPANGPFTPVWGTSTSAVTFNRAPPRLADVRSLPQQPTRSTPPPQQQQQQAMDDPGKDKTFYMKERRHFYLGNVAADLIDQKGIDLVDEYRPYGIIWEVKPIEDDERPGMKRRGFSIVFHNEQCWANFKKDLNAEFNPKVLATTKADIGNGMYIQLAPGVQPQVLDAVAADNAAKKFAEKLHKKKVAQAGQRRSLDESKRKTMLCRNFQLGFCKHGEKCAFIHPLVKPTN